MQHRGDRDAKPANGGFRPICGRFRARLAVAPGAFIAAYERCRLDATAALADGDRVVSAVKRFMGAARPVWQGLTSDLYRDLSQMIGEAQRMDDWPGNARWFGDRLRRSAPVLRTIGIDFRERRGAAGTKVTLSRLAPFATPRLRRGDTRSHPRVWAEWR